MVLLSENKDSARLTWQHTISWVTPIILLLLNSLHSTNSEALIFAKLGIYEKIYSLCATFKCFSISEILTHDGFSLKGIHLLRFPQ